MISIFIKDYLTLEIFIAIDDKVNTSRQWKSRPMSFAYLDKKLTAVSRTFKQNIKRFQAFSSHT